MLTGEIAPVALPEELHEATKLTIYVGRQEQISGDSGVRRRLRSAAPPRHRRCDARCSASTAPPTACAQRARFFGRNAEVPMMIIAVGAGEQIAAGAA